jgi:hypothetical protein
VTISGAATEPRSPANSQFPASDACELDFGDTSVTTQPELPACRANELGDSGAAQSSHYARTATINQLSIKPVFDGAIE